MQNRDEYLADCKTKALGYIPDDLGSAIGCMVWGLTKHPELKDHAGLRAVPEFYGINRDPAAVRRWIEEFN